MRRYVLLSCLLSIGVLLSLSFPVAAVPPAPTITPLVRTVDLEVGQSCTVTLSDGKKATVKLLDLKEVRDPLRNAVRSAKVTVEVNGHRVTIPAAFYSLPITVGDVQIDCAVTKGFVKPNDPRRKNVWALDADARLRLWPAGSPWIRPGTFTYPAKQRWFASDTQMANVPVFVDGGEVPANKSIYYHSGLDIGGAEGLVEIVAATDGFVISAGMEQCGTEKHPMREPRRGAVSVRGDRGWYYRYSHLCWVDPAVKPGSRIKRGQKLGLLGKESGAGWAHLHFDITAMQPSGRYGHLEGYAFLWQTYHQANPTKLQAVARPHHFVRTGDAVVFDATRSWSAAGPEGIVDYHWTFSDGATAVGTKPQRTYSRSGTYSEILTVTDKDGCIDYDFAVVQVIDREHPERVPPSVHATYWPTTDIRPGVEITFQVATFRVDKTEGHERWDFGDGSPAVQVQSDGPAVRRAKADYAVTTHCYQKPGHYLVQVQRTNDRGQTATARLHVVVGEGS
jgi:murein DD-endopeptidase MepM/ murein hydrolase activator NlpD